MVVRMSRFDLSDIFTVKDCQRCVKDFPSRGFSSILRNNKLKCYFKQKCHFLFVFQI